MSEIIPPPQEPIQPTDLPTVPADNPPGKLVLTLIGGAIFIGTGLLAIIAPFGLLVGLAVAIGSLFFKGYRFICLGYFLTLGVILLIAIIACAIDPPNFH